MDFYDVFKKNSNYSNTPPLFLTILGLIPVIFIRYFSHAMDSLVYNDAVLGVER